MEEVYKVTEEDWKKFSKDLKKFADANKDIVHELAGLTPHILEEDLKEALKYKKGYYKNENGLYVYVKGIEVTNDIGNLCRMGFNGEDRGVWIHFCEVDDKSVYYRDLPIASFSCSFFNPHWCKPKELLKPITKEEFDKQVKKAVKNICADYTEKRDPKEYLEYFKKEEKFYKKYEKFCHNVFSVTKDGSN